MNPIILPDLPPKLWDAVQGLDREELDVWHVGELCDADRTRGYWAQVKAVLNAVDCESQPMAEA